ncbi:hypothetical protein WQ54_20510 [Bacillus sp. SA1-12]|uniref:hypothetical protein n=1 Tax=Bacillus sp. SA1-12 TaxID=1455638 RepID=UPI000627070F|nr:hypothetical protein [Bacillus sp. SA1-12]KKI90352.1 hypothetical protein WQ54_20510 [Bacillus sp. SA1-12]
MVPLIKKEVVHKKMGEKLESQRCFCHYRDNTGAIAVNAAILISHLVKVELLLQHYLLHF